MRKLLLFGGFLFILQVIFGFNLLHFLYLLHGPTTFSENISYAAPPTGTVLGASTEIQNPEIQDSRVQAVRNFLTKYHSVLANYAQTIVDTADVYGIDYRLIPAIAMQESTGCNVIPNGSNNCWGFGVYAGKAKRFNSFEEAIDGVSKALAQHYVAKGRATPESIMAIWDPASPGTWAKGVRYFMDQM